LVRNVDATQLTTGAVTGARRWDAIIFNNPHTGARRDYAGTAALISGYLASASGVVSATGEVHVNITQSLLIEDMKADTNPGMVANALGYTGGYAGLSTWPTFEQSGYYARFTQRYATGAGFPSQAVEKLLNFKYAGGVR
jgi:hypothetical protein